MLSGAAIPDYRQWADGAGLRRIAALPAFGIFAFGARAGTFGGDMRSTRAAANALAAMMAASESDVLRLALPGGGTLIEAGETSGMVYVLRAGRLAAIRSHAGGAPQLLGLIWPGEAVGEISMLADIPHTATVIALRDSELFAMPREAFLGAIRDNPQIMLELMRTMIRRAGDERKAVDGAVTFGFVAAGEGPPIFGLVERIAREIRTRGSRVALLTGEHLALSTEDLSRLEDEHDHVFYSAETGEAAWTSICMRQADRSFWVGRGAAPPEERTKVPPTLAHAALKPIDLLLVHPVDTLRPSGGERWKSALGCHRLFHLREGDADDLGRFARVITSRSVGVVLSGGGARGYAHVGALRALAEHGVPVDFVGGASMGAVIAAGSAAGWSGAELDERVRRAFVETNPLSDLAVPVLSLARGRVVDKRLAENFGGIDIADLWRPFFCVSSDLTAGRHRLHDRGPLTQALRASIALPGILPPVIEGETVLVDGGVMRNLPVDLMQEAHDGPIIAIDVSIDTGLSARDIEMPRSLLRWVASGAWRKGAPIVSLLLRSATVTATRDVIAARGAADVFVAPQLDGVEIRDWRAYAPAVEAGYAATAAALARLDCPATELRARRGV
jgi:NTE family protein